MEPQDMHADWSAREILNHERYDAVAKLYYSGKWHCDKLPEDAQAKLWEAVRDSFGFEPGFAPEE
jgi:hypothetical protein